MHLQEHIQSKQNKETKSSQRAEGSELEKSDYLCYRQCVLRETWVPYHMAVVRWIEVLALDVLSTRGLTGHL